ncbi:MAG: glycosyltransferase family 4 protein [Chloroflexota bacterium]
MRVAIAGDFPEEPGRIVGGIQAVIYYTLLGLADYPNLDIHVVSCEKWGQAGQSGPFSRPGPHWQAHYLPSPQGIPHTLSMLTIDRRRLAQAIRALKPDLVHAHGQAAAYPWAAFDSGRPTVVTAHGLNSLEAQVDQRGGWLRGRLRALLWRQVEQSCLRRAADVVVISPFVADTIRPWTRARLHPIENPVDPTLFDLDRQAGIPGRLLYVGSIQKRKGLADLLQALAHLPAAHLVVAGGFSQPYADYGRRIRQLVAELHLEERVHFLGHLDRASLQQEYRQCAVFCLPSYLEASPVVVAEAMAAGCPIVTTAIASTAHLIEDGQTGYRVPAGNPLALAARVEQLLSNPAEAQAMGDAARRVALRRFTPTQAAAATHELYQQMMNDEW